MSEGLKVGFDLGGVITKYPEIFTNLINILKSANAELYIISDIHPLSLIEQQLIENGFAVDDFTICSADYNQYGDACKSMVCEAFKIDIFIDDFLAYLTPKGGAAVKLLLIPNEYLPYYSDTWKGEASFGRKRRKE